MSCPVHLPAGEHSASGFHFLSRNLRWVGSCGYFGTAAGQTWVMLLPQHPCYALAQDAALMGIWLPSLMLIVSWVNCSCLGISILDGYGESSQVSQCRR